ncbi:MAG: lytic murein transglycosylase B [Gallionella sp.]
MKYTHVIAALALLLPAPFANSVALPGIPEFIDQMVARHNFQRSELESAFAHAQLVQPVIDAISRPSTAKPWPEYRANFVNPQRIRMGLAFWKKYRKTLQRAERKYGVPQDIIVAVIGVETIYGQDDGNYRTLDALTTLAFEYPPRADFFRSELENFLLLARDQQLDLLAIRGSYAGALGIPQFMPSTYRTYAVDFNGNRRINLLRENTDAIGSVANYLKEVGWTGRISEQSPVAGLSPAIKPQAAAVAPIAVPVRVGEDICPGDITTPRTVAAWSLSGITPGVKLPQDQTARLIDFTMEESDEITLAKPAAVGPGGQSSPAASPANSAQPKKEFWLVFNNFDVIRRYNNSDYYAMTVFQLAEALKQASKHHSRQAMRRAPL